MIVDLTFHEQWHVCQVRRQPSYSGSFAWLGSHPSLWLLDSQTNLLNWFALQFLSCSQLRGTNQCCWEGWKQNSFVQFRHVGNDVEPKCVIAEGFLPWFVWLMIVLIYAQFISPRAFMKDQPLNLHCQRAKNVLPSRVCYLAHLGPHPYSKRQLQKDHNFGTATS